MVYHQNTSGKLNYYDLKHELSCIIYESFTIEKNIISGSNDFTFYERPGWF